MQDLIRPFLPKDVEESKLKFPLYMLPKIDGSFAFVQNAKLYARSLKQHENLYTTNFYSNPDFEGLRGEMIAGDKPAIPDLCRDTSSALRRIEGEPITSLWCFDYVTQETKNLAYKERYKLLQDKVLDLNSKGYTCIHCIEAYLVENLEQYKALQSAFMQAGYEGVVVRDMNCKHKEGRSSAVKPELWRWKPYATAEIKVLEIEEGSTNNNEAITNELGRTKRSTHQENMQANGMVGALIGSLVKDLEDYSGNIVAKAGDVVKVSAGEMTAKERKYYFENPCEILEKIVEFSYMSYGLKDKPRFPIFKRIRSEIDM